MGGKSHFINAHQMASVMESELHGFWVSVNLFNIIICLENKTMNIDFLHPRRLLPVDKQLSKSKQTTKMNSFGSQANVEYRPLAIIDNKT